MEWRSEEMRRNSEARSCSGTAKKRHFIKHFIKRRNEHEKIIVGVASVLASALLMAGCNKQVVDLTYEYSWAQLKMPDGTIVEGNVESWCDYEGDQLQVVIDGVTYLVHSSNIVMRH